MGFQALEAFGSVGAFSNPWITFSWARAVGVSAKAAEPRPSACRKERRVRELGEGCFSDAAPGSEPGYLPVFMASSMADWEGASRRNRKAGLEGAADRILRSGGQRQGVIASRVGIEPGLPELVKAATRMDTEIGRAHV